MIARVPPADRAILRDALSVGLGTSLYAIAFGAIAVQQGFTTAQTCVLSLVMFTGASQFALVSVAGAGGGAWASLSVAWLLGARNGLYSIRLARLLPANVAARLASAQLVLDESTAMAVARDDDRGARLGFWATGLAVFVGWNVATLLGALAGSLVEDPNDLGLDAAFAAGFLALVAPRLRDRPALFTGALAVAIALAAVPFTRAGAPILLAALAVFPGAALARRQAR